MKKMIVIQKKRYIIEMTDEEAADLFVALGDKNFNNYEVLVLLKEKLKIAGAQK